MRAATRVRLGVGALLLVQLGTTFAAVGLLVRMSPVMDRFSGEQLAELHAAQSLLAVLAQVDCAAVRTGEDLAFREALATLRLQAEADGVRADLDRLEGGWEEMRTGVCDRRPIWIALVRDCARSAQEGVEEAARLARRQSTTGAWVAVLLGLASFALSMLVVRSIQRRILDPLEEIGDVMHAARTGDLHRRCPLLHDPVEFSLLTSGLNQILDERLQDRRTSAHFLHPSELVLLDRLMDRIEHEALVVDAGGHVLAANRGARERLRSPDGDRLRSELIKLATTSFESPPPWIEIALLPDTGARLCLLLEEPSA